MSDRAHQLLALIRRVAGKCLLVSQAHVKLATEKEVPENEVIDDLWAESLLAQKNDMEWIDSACFRVAAEAEGLQFAGFLSDGEVRQMGFLVYRMNGMAGVASNPSGTFADYYKELQAVVNAYVTVYRETKALPGFAGDGGEAED